MDDRFPKRPCDDRAPSPTRGRAGGLGSHRSGLLESHELRPGDHRRPDRAHRRVRRVQPRLRGLSPCRQRDQGVSHAAARHQIQRDIGGCLATRERGGPRDRRARRSPRGSGLHPAGSDPRRSDGAGIRGTRLDDARPPPPGWLAVGVLRGGPRVAGLSKRPDLGVHPVPGARPDRSRGRDVRLLADPHVGWRGDHRRGRRHHPIRGPPAPPHGQVLVAGAPRSGAALPDRGGGQHRSRPGRVVRRGHRGRTLGRRGRARGATHVRPAPDPRPRASA